MLRAAARTALAVLGVAALLAGCRTAPPPAAVIGPGADAPWAEQRAALEDFASYHLTGRVAVAANGQGFSAGLRYTQQPKRSDLALDGPLGIGGLRVELEGDDLRIFTSRGEQLDGVAARTELERRLGFVLPLAELRWWLLGVPMPGTGTSSVIQEAEGGEIHAFEQNGWQVRIESRAPGLGFALPKRLTAEREGARMKLLAETWRP
ncbi:MAG: lipoprotein insertase outer membrane protein LolB [Pseudomonadota bacterium]